MRSRISKELAYFLKKNGIYTLFRKYTNSDNSLLVSLNSFDWRKTEEGYMFWRDVQDAYFNFMTQKLSDYWLSIGVSIKI